MASTRSRTASPASPGSDFDISAAVAQGARGHDAVAQSCQIARPAAADRKPRQGAGDIGRGAQVSRAHARAQFVIAQKERHRIVAMRRLLARRSAARQGARPRARAPAAVTVRSMTDSRLPLRSPAKRLGQFQIAPRRAHRCAMKCVALISRQRLERGKLALLRQVEIGDQRARRRQFGAGKGAEPVKLGNAVMAFSARARPLPESNFDRGQRRQRAAKRFEQRRKRVVGQQACPAPEARWATAAPVPPPNRLARPPRRETSPPTYRRWPARIRRLPGQGSPACWRARASSSEFFGQRARRHQPDHLARTTDLAPRFLASAGSSTCSQTATRKPLRISFSR